jgi:hypothetical protein
MLTLWLKQWQATDAEIKLAQLAKDKATDAKVKENGKYA